MNRKTKPTLLDVILKKKKEKRIESHSSRLNFTWLRDIYAA